MRLDGVTGMKAGNDWLPGYILRHNQQFARTPARPDNLHRAVTESPDRLTEILCWRDERYVGQQLTLSYERRQIMLEENGVARSLPVEFRRQVRRNLCLGRWAVRSAPQGVLIALSFLRT